MFRHFLISAVPAIALAGLAGTISAQTIPSPTEKVVLTISGDISTTNVDGTLQLDLPMLAAMDQAVVETSTIWTNGVLSFQGVELATLAALLGVTEGALLATAINDYTVEIPVSDAVEGGALIAYLMDGEEMSIRDKGPLWIVYPYDSNPDFRTEVIYSRSIWQLDRIEVVR